MKTEKNNDKGMKLDMVLLVIFIVLKLTGVIDWSWLWVLSPLWISIGLTIIIGLLYIIGLVLDADGRN